MIDRCLRCGRPENWPARAGRPERPSHPAPRSNRFPACEKFVGKEEDK